MRLLGVDLGGTQLRARLCSEQGETLAEQKALVQERRPDAVVQQLATLVEEMLEEEGGARESLVISCAVAGMLDATGRTVMNAPNLLWRVVPFAKLLEEGIPQASEVLLWNDLDAATWGEVVAGAGRGVSQAVSVFVGSGVGGCALLGGELYRGVSGVAGEAGHLKVVPGGRRCGCGGCGCVEAYAGGHQMAAIALEIAEEGRSPYLQSVQQSGEEITPEHIAAGVREGDAACAWILEQAGNALGLLFSHLVTFLNPSRLIVGGGVFQHWPELRTLAKQRMDLYISTPARDAVEVVLSELGNDAGMVGAVALAQRHRKGQSSA